MNKLNLLIIDDDEVDRMALRRTLKQAEINACVTEASSKAEGLEALQTETFDCVFLDYQLPDGDGLTLLHELEAAEISAPVVMMTGQGSEELAVEMLHAGAQDYLPKAKMTVQALARVVRNVIRVHQAEAAGKAAQVRLAESSSHLQYLIDNSPAIIYSAVPTGDFKITFVSENLHHVLGYEPRAMLDDMNFWFEHIHPDDRAGLMQRLPQLLAEGGQQSHDYRFRHSDGHYLWMHDRLRMVYDKAGVPSELLGSLLDITERKAMEEALHQEKEEQRTLIRELQEARDQLLQNEKMAAIGQLAAGVAHEINNPVGYINSNLNSLARYLENMIEVINLYQVIEPLLEQHHEVLDHVYSVKKRFDLDYIKEDVCELVNECIDGTARVKQIVQDLKEFSHVDEAEWQQADLHQGLDSTLNIVNNEIKYKAEVIKEYGELPPVECIASQINQVFMNLLVNAAHAIEAYGTITLRSGTRDGGAWVEIADSGTGIKPEHLRRLFEPFFTTKPVGGGTGLGLSLSFGIIKKHGGRIDVQSEVGQGTCFTVWLPLKQAEDVIDGDGVVQDEKTGGMT
ncbi:Histidine kinase [hydrothermal vent metagenome]|uniref:Histidine kinase n=1 Tax=hydrothermal vent metagenome TaxID=652676 RepID=A0A3B1A1E6_9ZZZZ